MKYYELSYLISSDLSEEELKNLSQKLHSFILEEGGILAEAENPVKEKLGYPVKKKGAAFLVNLNFQLNPEGLANIEKKLRAEGQILRYILVAKKRPKVEVPMTIGGRRPGWSPEILVKPKREIPKPKKVELKEIERKLEEILGE